jgi:ABC-2 type transport system permease protein
MRTIWYIAKKDLLQVLKDRNSFLLLLAVPLILITVVGLAFGGLFNSSASQISISVAVSNQDSGYVGKTVVDALKINNSQLVVTVNQFSDAAQVKQQVADGKDSAGVVVPSGTTDKLIAASQTGTPSQNLVQFYAIPSNNDPNVTITQGIVTSVVNQLVSAQFAGTSAVGQVYSICNRPGNHCAPDTIDAASIASTVGKASAATAQTAQVEALTAGKVPGKVNAFDFALPGYAILFALFGIQSAAATILQEKEDGTFRRLLIAPIQKYSLLGGKLLAQFLLTLTQLLVLFVIGYFAFHLTIGSWPTVVALLIATSFATTGLGIFLVSIVKTRRQLSPIVTLVTLTTSAIGGAWWPLSIEPVWMQQVAKVGITAWAMEGLNGVMLAGKAFTEVVPDVLGLVAYGVICFVIAMRFFRFQEKAA